MRDEEQTGRKVHGEVIPVARASDDSGLLDEEGLADQSVDTEICCAGRAADASRQKARSLFIAGCTGVADLREPPRIHQ